MNVKKIIAREGLTLIGFLIMGSVLFFGGRYYQRVLASKTYFTLTRAQIDKMEGGGVHIFALPDEKFMAAIGLTKDQRKQIEREWRRDRFLSFLSAATKAIGIFLACAGYPLYLLLRFILWASGILRRK